jgi:hypothetical protein
VSDSSRHNALYGLAQINAYGNGDAPDEGLRRLETLFQEGRDVAISTNTFLPLLRAYARRGMLCRLGRQRCGLQRDVQRLITGMQLVFFHQS